MDADDESRKAAYQHAARLETTDFALDQSRPERTYMGHMINPCPEIEKGLGYQQYEIFVPIRLK